MRDSNRRAPSSRSNQRKRKHQQDWERIIQGLCRGGLQSAFFGVTTESQERELDNAEKQIETKIEIEDPPRRQEALQVYRQRQDQARAFRKAPLDGLQSARPHAQAEEAHAGGQSRRGQRQADASLRLKPHRFPERAAKLHAIRFSS